MTSDEIGTDLEHVEVLQRKFDEFQKDLTSQEYRVTEVTQLAEKLITDQHPDQDTIRTRKEVRGATRDSCNTGHHSQGDYPTVPNTGMMLRI